MQISHFPPILYSPEYDRRSTGSGWGSSSSIRTSAMKCPWRAVSATTFVYKRDLVWEFLPVGFQREFKTVNPFPHSVCDNWILLYFNEEKTVRDPVSHSRSCGLCGSSDKVWTLSPHHGLSSWAPWLGRRYQQEPQKHHPDVTDHSGASGFVSGSQQGAEKLLSAPNAHERKTKFHHNVDHLWMWRIFQERPLEKGTGKIMTIVLREHDLKREHWFN